MVAQIYTQAYPKEVGGFILISTGGMDAETIKVSGKSIFGTADAVLYEAL